MSEKRRIFTACFVIAAMVVLLNLVAAWQLGYDKEVGSDALYYRELAVNLAAGNGYVLMNHTYWIGQPSMRRLPGWPYVVSLAIKMFPSVPPNRLMRVTNVLLMVFAAMALFCLANLLFRDVWASFMASVFFVFHPIAVLGCYMGWSELLFILLVASGMCLLLMGRRLPFLVGCLILGFSCLSRANFILMPFFIVGILCLVVLRFRRFPEKKWLVQLILGCILFLAPPVMWAVRNYKVCGAFPVLSALRGQTFYGGNNEIVAKPERFLGYWVFPDEISGETPMRELAQTMSEYEVDCYYYDKGKRFIADNPGKMPLLLVGKLLRAYVPITWHFSLAGLVASGYRWVLYILAGMGLYVGWKKMSELWQLLLLAMVLTNVASVLVFWGSARFAFALEPFFMPFAGYGTVWLWEKILRASRRGAESAEV